MQLATTPFPAFPPTSPLRMVQARFDTWQEPMLNWAESMARPVGSGLVFFDKQVFEMPGGGPKLANYTLYGPEPVLSQTTKALREALHGVGLLVG